MMKRLLQAISPYLHVIIILVGGVLIGFRLLSNGNTFEVFVLCIVLFTWILQEKAFSEQAEELQSEKRHSFFTEKKLYKAKQREEIAYNMLTDEQAIDFLKITSDRGFVDNNITVYRHFCSYSENGLYDYGDYSFLK